MILAALRAALVLALLAGLVVFVTRTSRATARWVWLLAFTLVLGGGVATMVAHSFLAKWGFKGDSPRDGLVSMMSGTASRPFVYRRLAPDLVRAGTDVCLTRLPARAIDCMVSDSHLRRYGGWWRADGRWSSDESWTPRKAVSFHIAYVLVWLSLFGTLLSAAALLRTLLGITHFHAVVASSLGMCLVPLMFVGGGYLYDSTELLLWTTTLLIVAGGWLPLTPLAFALMLFNKESALLVVAPLFPMLLRRVGRVRASLLTAALGLMGCIWLWFVRSRYAALPGSPQEWSLPGNVVFWLQPATYFKFQQLFSPALPAPRGANVVLLLLLLLPLRYGWFHVRSDIRWATALIAAVLFPLFMTAACRDEVRNLSLSFPLVFVVAVAGVQRLFAASTESVEHASGE